LKIILSGYPGSKKIIPLSSYLLTKYTKNYFDIHFLNYGSYNGEIFNCNYVELSKYQRKIGDWGSDILNYLKKLDDKYIIFSLDDFLISTWIDIDFLDNFLHTTLKNIDFLNIKLGILPVLIRPKDCMLTNTSKDLLKLKYDASYKLSTQYTIWNRSKLVKLIENYSYSFFWKKNLTPWDFELQIDQRINLSDECFYCLKCPQFIYYGGSSLSSRNKDKICVNGLKEEDLKYFISNNYLNENNLILSHMSKKHLNFDFTFDQQFYLKPHPYDDVNEVKIFKKESNILYNERDK